MEKKQRVPKGEKYWIIDVDGEIWYRDNNDGVMDDKLYETGNYFRSKEEAEAMANKLRAVLKGADVIEMPSEEDSVSEMKKQNLVLLAEFGWQACYNWLKSKILK